MEEFLFDTELVFRLVAAVYHIQPQKSVSRCAQSAINSAVLHCRLIRLIIIK